MKAQVVNQHQSPALFNLMESQRPVSPKAAAVDHYQLDHLLAKAIVCCAVISLGVIGINTGSPYVSLVPGTVVWFFGVNTSGYLIESLLHHDHLHNLF
jgi:hypothetical protein